MAPAAKPLVTVMALCYNHERFVLECLESIRAQTFQDFRLIITDDASTDRSAELISGWIGRHRPDATFIRHTQNRGLCATLNEALTTVSTKYLAKIATDDLWMPEKLERQSTIMESLPDKVAVLYGDAYQIDEAGTLLPERFLKAYRIVGDPPTGDLFPRLVQRNFIPSLTTMIRMDCLREVGGYDERLAYEDWDMWLRISQRYEFAFFDYVSAKYRIVPNSMVRTVVPLNSPTRVWSDVLLMAKCLRSAHPKTAQALRLRARILVRAYRLYRLHDVRAGPALRQAFWARRADDLDAG
jgi:glycosyltransferase involved in cell wall biosynthesis